MSVFFSVQYTHKVVEGDHLLHGLSFLPIGLCYVGTFTNKDGVRVHDPKSGSPTDWYLVDRVPS